MMKRLLYHCATTKYTLFSTFLKTELQPDTVCALVAQLWYAHIGCITTKLSKWINVSAQQWYFLLLSPEEKSSSWTCTIDIRIMKRLLYHCVTTKYTLFSTFLKTELQLDTVCALVAQLWYAHIGCITTQLSKWINVSAQQCHFLLSPNENSSSWTCTIDIRIMKRLFYHCVTTKYTQSNDFNFISKLNCN